jgi:hypothetical protein
MTGLDEGLGSDPAAAHRRQPKGPEVLFSELVNESSARRCEEMPHSERTRRGFCHEVDTEHSHFVAKASVRSLDAGRLFTLPTSKDCLAWPVRVLALRTRP